MEISQKHLGIYEKVCLDIVRANILVMIGDDIHRHIFDLSKLDQKYSIYGVL